MSDIKEGSRVTAPNPKADGDIQSGVVKNDLSVMYFIKFDNGQEDFVFKVQQVNLEE